MTYHYRCTTFRNGEKVFERDCKIDGAGLYHSRVEIGYTGFLILLDRWNKYSLQSAESGYLHVYTTIPPG